MRLFILKCVNTRKIFNLQGCICSCFDSLLRILPTSFQTVYCISTAAFSTPTQVISAFTIIISFIGIADLFYALSSRLPHCIIFFARIYPKDLSHIQIVFLNQNNQIVIFQMRMEFAVGYDFGFYVQVCDNLIEILGSKALY